MIPAFLQQEQELGKDRLKSPNRRLIHYSLERINVYRERMYSHCRVDHHSFLKQIDSRVLVGGFLFFAILNSCVFSPLALLVFCLLLGSLLKISGIKLFRFLLPRLMTALVFGFFLFIPASLNLFSGEKVWIVLIQFPHAFLFPGGIRIPSEIGFTISGLVLVLKLFLRLLNILLLVGLLLRLMSAEQVLEAFGELGLPSLFCSVLLMSFRYLSVFIHLMAEMLEALELRWIGGNGNAAYRELLGRRIVVLFKKSHEYFEETWQAMLARGYSQAGVRQKKRAFSFCQNGVIIVGLLAAALVLILISRINL